MLAANLHAQTSQQAHTHTHRHPNIATNTYTNTHVVEDVATLNNALWELKKELSHALTRVDSRASVRHCVLG